jgi:hypothetical protein
MHNSGYVPTRTALEYSSVLFTFDSSYIVMHGSSKGVGMSLILSRFLCQMLLARIVISVKCLHLIMFQANSLVNKND